MTDETDGVTSVELARNLGVFEATMIGVGAMIGAGIFVLTGLASGKAGPAALLAFGLNGVVTLFTALSYAELSSAIPEAGGGYAYVKKVMPNAVAFLSGWMLWFAYVVACSLYAKGFGSYFLEFFHRYLSSLSKYLLNTFGHELSISLLTLAVGILFIAINIIGAEATGQAENIMTMAKILVLAVFVAFGLAQVWSEPELTRNNFDPFLPKGVTGIVTAMGLTFIAFEGYDLIATVSEEVKNPQETIPKAILYSLGITVIVYLMVVFVCLGAVPPIDGTPTWKALGNFGELGVVQAAGSFMPRFGVILVLGGGLFATLSALNATILASSRVAFSMGRDWMLPNQLSIIHSTRKTPVAAIMLSGLLFLGVALFFPLETIGTASSLLFLMTFILVNLSLIYFRRRTEPDPETFQVPFYPLTPILGILTCGGIAMFQLFHEWVAGGLACGWLLVGLGIYYAFFSSRASISDVSKAMESPELLELRNSKKYKILVPLSNPERVEPLIDLAGEIGHASQGTVIGINVVDLPDVTSYSDAEPFVNQARQNLEHAQQRGIELEVPFSTILKIGRSVPGEILQTARDNRCDLILMGYNREQDPLEDSIIDSVITGQPCDVAILKTSRPSLGAIDELLIPVEGREVHDKLKVRLAHSLHRATDCSVRFVTVIPEEADSQRETKAEGNLDHVKKIYDIPSAKTSVLREEDPARAIAGEAGDRSLVILGMREEPWLESFFFGSMAQRIASQLNCPVLMTKSHAPRRVAFRRVLKQLNPLSSSN